MRINPNAVTKTGMRTRNLSALLYEIHYRRAVSRVELAASLGLSKTTVSALVEELSTLGLIESFGAESRAGAGRPGELLTPSDRRTVLVVNPEIDVTTIGLVAMGGRILFKERFVHPRTQPSTLRQLTQQIENFLVSLGEPSRDMVEAMLLVVPGAVDSDTETVVAAPSILWNDVHANVVLERVAGCPVTTMNNGRAATIGEWAFGAARNHHDAVCIFSGTGGIGGGMIVNGLVVSGASGLAGEIGKMRIHDSDLGMPGNLSFEHLMKRDAIVAELGFTELSDEQFRQELFSALKTRPLVSVQAQSRVLGNALATLRDLLDPEVIVLGGYLGSLLEAQRTQLLLELNEGALTKRGDDFLVARSIGLDDMVLLGAAETHWRHVLADPSSSVAGHM
jgi:predicted NBD/HSP70 family sugar kinase